MNTEFDQWQAGTRTEQTPGARGGRVLVLSRPDGTPHPRAALRLRQPLRGRAQGTERRRMEPVSRRLELGGGRRDPSKRQQQQQQQQQHTSPHSSRGGGPSGSPRSHGSKARRKSKRKPQANNKGKPMPKPPTSLSKLERDTIRACAKTVAERGPQMEARIRSGKDASTDNGIWAFLREECVGRTYYHELLLWHQAQAERIRVNRMAHAASPDVDWTSSVDTSRVDAPSMIQPEPEPEPEPTEPEPKLQPPRQLNTRSEIHGTCTLLGVDITVADWVQLIAKAAAGARFQDTAQMSREQLELLHEITRAYGEQEHVARLEREVEAARRELIRARACRQVTTVRLPATVGETAAGNKHTVDVHKNKGGQSDPHAKALSALPVVDTDDSVAEEGVPPGIRSDELLLQSLPGDELPVPEGLAATDELDIPSPGGGWVVVDQELREASSGDQSGLLGSKGTLDGRELPSSTTVRMHQAHPLFVAKLQKSPSRTGGVGVQKTCVHTIGQSAASMGRSTADQKSQPRPRSDPSTDDAGAVEAQEAESHHSHLVTLWAQATMSQFAKETGEQQGDSLIAG